MSIIHLTTKTQSFQPRYARHFNAQGVKTAAVQVRRFKLIKKLSMPTVSQSDIAHGVDHPQAGQSRAQSLFFLKDFETKVTSSAIDGALTAMLPD
jgi:hypothetical protein